MGSPRLVPVGGLVLVAVAVAAAGWLALWLRPQPVGEQVTSDPAAPVPSAGGGPTWFADVTAGSGVDFTYRNGEEAGRYSILESVGGGVALLDYDGDGRLDVFVTGGGGFGGPAGVAGRPGRLYRNLGGMQFADVTGTSGPAPAGGWWYTHGAAAADFDRDGWPDLLVTGYGRVGLFRNESHPDGRRRLVDRSADLKVADDGWCTSAAWADVNGDGYPDVYLCRYCDWSFANDPVCPGQVAGVERDVCPPQRFKPLVHRLFLNEAGKGFQEVGAEYGFKAAGQGLGVVAADVNADGRPDLYVANDASNNFLFLNRNGRLEEVGMRAGVAVDDEGNYDGSMGVDVGDYDGSGRASIWVTNFQGDLHALYRNLGRPPPNEAFDHQSRAAGVASVGTHLVGFGTAFVDVDRDGWDDLVVLNGHVVRHPGQGSTFRQKPVLLRNVERHGRRAFEDAAGRGGEFFRTPALGRGLAVGDLDDDGRPDLVACHTNSPVAVLRNVAPGPANWVGFRLRGRGHRDLAGSTVVVETGARTLTRFVKGGGSYLSSGDPRVLFGLGPDPAVRRVSVRWSWGGTESWTGLAAGAYHDLREGEGEGRR